MSDFRIDVTADLLTKDLDKKLKQYQNGKIKIPISLDVKNTLSDVEKQVGKTSQKIQTSAIDQVKKNFALKDVDKFMSTLQKNFEKQSFGVPPKEMDRYKKDLQSMYKLKDNLEKSLSVLDSNDKNKIDAFFKQYDTLKDKQKKLRNELAIDRNREFDLLKNNEGVIASQKSLAWLQKNTKAYKRYGEEIKNISKLQSKTMSNMELRSLNKRMSGIKAEAALSGMTGLSFGDELKRSIKTIGQFVGVYGLLKYSVVDGSKAMVRSVVDVDTAMTELRKVSEAPSTHINKYFSEATDSAKKYGMTISNVIESTADWTRLGYSLPDAKKLSDITSLYTNVGDNITRESASSSLISTLQGFHKTADEAMHIVDVYNEVGNRFAVNSGGLGESMRRSASSLYAAGNTFEESIGLITAADTVLQDPAKVGTAWKTITMRIRGAKTEMEELGLDTDGMADSVSKMRDELLALSGVDIMKDKNTFKSTFQVMEEVADRWEHLTDIQRASVTELLAGKRQGNLISAVMTNFDIARKARDTALNSDGSALAENEKKMDSILGKLGRLKATAQQVSNSIVSSSAIKFAIDGANQLLEILNKIVSVGKGIPALFAGIGIGKFLRNRDCFIIE